MGGHSDKWVELKPTPGVGLVKAASSATFGFLMGDGPLKVRSFYSPFTEDWGRMCKVTYPYRALQRAEYNVKTVTAHVELLLASPSPPAPTTPNSSETACIIPARIIAGLYSPRRVSSIAPFHGLKKLPSGY